MIEAQVLAGAALILSVFFWGIPRTAAWVVIAILLRFLHADFFFVCCYAVLSLFVVASLVLPYRKNAFDFRAMPRSRVIASIAVCGIFGSLRFGPLGILVSILAPFVLHYLFLIIRFPWTPIYYFPRGYKWIAPAFFFIWLAVYINEITRYVRHFA